MGASGLVLAASFWVSGELQGIALLAGIVIVANLLLMAVHMLAMHRAGGASRESVRLLNRGPLGWTFWIGVVLVGMIAPLLLVALGQSVALAGSGLLVGTFLFRYCVLMAGVYVPPVLADLGKLKRLSADLQQEYAGIAQHYARGSR